MRNLVKKIILSFFLLFFSFPVFAASFFIQDYKVDIEVNENKSARVTEEILVEFKYASHGIIREIPHPKASVSRISVSEKYSVSKVGGNVEIQIGDADKTIQGQHKYTISYNYNYHDNKPEFYHNIIGTEWKVPIRNASFRIRMPKEFDGEKAGLSIGKTDTAGFDGGAAFRVVDNIVIEGHMERELAKGEGITFRTEVPKGYFNRYFPYADAIAIAVSAILALIAYILWAKYGKDEHVPPVVTFEIPKGLNAVQAEFAYKGDTSTKGLAAFLIELANKGYVDIQNQHRNFIIRKLASCEDDPMAKKYLDALFPKKNIVTHYELKTSRSYYVKCQQILTSAGSKMDMIYDMRTIEGKIPQAMLRIISAIFLIGVFAFADFSFRGFFAGGIASIVAFALFMISPIIMDVWNLLTKVWMIITGPALIIITMLFDGSSYENLGTVGIISIFLLIALVCGHYLPKRNAQGKVYLGELMGLRKFIQTAELPELEAMAESNPRQFYNILPYAYILGVSDVWTKKLDNFLQTHPSEGKPRYHVHNIDSFASKIGYLSEASTDNGGLSSSSSSSSGRSYSRSSSGGGGRVGGGGGGGGGRSW